MVNFFSQYNINKFRQVHPYSWAFLCPQQVMSKVFSYLQQVVSEPWFDGPLNGLRITLKDVMHRLKLKVGAHMVLYEAGVVLIRQKAP